MGVLIERDLILKSTTKLIDFSLTENNKTIVSNGYLVEADVTGNNLDQLITN